MTSTVPMKGLGDGSSSESGAFATNIGLGHENTRLMFVPFEIRYSPPKGDEVYILWGLDGWMPVDESLHPEGSTLVKGYPYCRMDHDGKDYSIKLNLPSGAIVDYCFHVLSSSEGIDYWDINSIVNRDYHSKVISNGSARVVGSMQTPERHLNIINLWKYLAPIPPVLFLVIFRPKLRTMTRRRKMYSIRTYH